MSARRVRLVALLAVGVLGALLVLLDDPRPQRRSPAPVRPVVEVESRPLPRSMDAEPPPAPDSKRSVAIRTQDESARPLAGVDLHALVAARPPPVHLGKSDDRGELTVPGLRSGTTLVARRPNYQPATVAVGPAGADARITMTLRAAATIEGRVVLKDGTPPPVSCHVLAVPHGSILPTVTSRSQLLGDPRLCLGSTDESGYFTVDGLAAGMRYDIWAGGPGHVTPVRGFEVPVPAGTRGLVVVVERLYGAVVRLVDSEAGDLRVSPGVSGASEGYTCHDPAAMPVSGRAPAVVLAGVDETALTSDHDHARCVLYTSAADRPAPVLFSCRLPGYEPVQAVIPTGPISDSIPTGVVKLRASARDFATLQAVVVGLPEDRPAGSVDVGVLRFVHVSGGGFAARCTAGTNDWSIPAGRYRVSFEALAGGRLGPDDEPVDLSPGARRVLTIDFRGFGAVLAAFSRGGDLAVAERSGTLELFRGQADVPVVVRHVSAPEAWIPGVPAGDYQWQFASDDARSPRRPIAIQPDKTSVLFVLE